MIARFTFVTAFALSAGVAMAQEAATPPAMPDMGAAYESARNQLGVLTYCQEQGHIDGKAVETQTKLLSMIPAGDTAKGDAAEELGKKGTVSAMGVERSLDDAAKEQNTDVAALCKQMDALLAQMAAQLPG